MKIILESYRYGDEVGIMCTGDADEEGRYSFAGTADSLVDAFNLAMELLQAQSEFAESMRAE